MFNKLFNRRELEQKIEDLENENQELRLKTDSLRKRLEKRDERTKNADRIRQAAEEKLNKAENRIKVLEHELAAVKEQATETLTFRKTVLLPISGTAELLHRIGSVRSEEQTLLTVRLEPGANISGLKIPDRIFAQDNETTTLLDSIKSPTGLILFHDTTPFGGISLVMSPPFPVTKSGWELDTRFNTIVPMGEEQVAAILAAHAGESFIGIGDTDTLFEYNIVKSSVKEKHTKGGWSQRRFERLRDEDIDHHIEKVQAAFEAMTDDFPGEIDVIVAGGDYSVAHGILKNQNRPVIFRKIGAKVEKHNPDNIRKEVWSSRWYELP